MNARPQRRYRADFRQLLLGDRPDSVLDVGCGTGSMLQHLVKAGVATTGVEADATHVTELRDRGYEAQLVEGERLPFPDDTFDVVASEFCAHHFADLALHLAEAQRVARRAVWLLDPWYDESLASQRLMQRWDRWFKIIDRRQGRVHNDTLTVADFVAALPNVPMARLEFRHWLHLAPVDLDWFDAESAEHLELATAEERAELAAIRTEAVEDGMTDDGAIVVRVAVG